MSKNAYLDFVLEWLAPLGEITSRAMMGGYVLYCDGVVFALVANNTLHLKVGDVTRPRFEELGLKAFQPFPDNPGTMQYYPPPPEFFEDSDAMLEWGRAAVEVGKQAVAKKEQEEGAGAGEETSVIGGTEAFLRRCYGVGNEVRSGSAAGISGCLGAALSARSLASAGRRAEAALRGGTDRSHPFI